MKIRKLPVSIGPVRNQLAGQNKVVPSKPSIAPTHLARQAPNRPVSPAPNGHLGFSNTGRKMVKFRPLVSARGSYTSDLIEPAARSQYAERATQRPLLSPLSGHFAQILGPGREFYPEVEIPCPGADFLLVRGRLPRKNGLLVLQDKVVPSKSSIARVLPGLHSKGRSNGNYGGENGGVKVRLTWS